MKENENSIFYPPGGILIWIIIVLEIVTFSMGIGSLLYQKSKNIDEFLKMQSTLSLTYGLWNTVFLITSGFFMALTIHYHKAKIKKGVSISLLIAIVFGCFFLFLKSLEFIGKWNSNYTLHTSDFFAYYWLLTGFHFVHVLVGVIILLYVFTIKDEILLENLEASASFWHMCDLIWIFLFPALYLVR